MRTYSHRKWFFAPLILVAIALFSAVTMVLWNALLPDLFHFPQINFWQAAGILILARLLFGGHFGKHNPYWKNRIREKWMNMSPEEREKFYQHLREHGHNWGYHCGDFKAPESAGSKQNP